MSTHSQAGRKSGRLRTPDPARKDLTEFIETNTHSGTANATAAERGSKRKVGPPPGRIGSYPPSSVRSSVYDGRMRRAPMYRCVESGMTRTALPVFGDSMIEGVPSTSP